MIDLTNPIFSDPDKAREHLEAIRWPEGPICPHCGNLDPERITKLEGKAHRAGLYKCNECREQFSATVGTVMERSHIPINKWVAAFYLMASSKKGVSAHQLMRTLGIGSYRSAWFMAHRVREAMKDDTPFPLGGAGKVVEVDEQYHGKRETPRKRNKYSPKPTKKGRSGSAEKRVILGLVERGGKARRFHIQQATIKEVWDKVARNIDRETVLHTDEANIYKSIGEEFERHETVQHSRGEYARWQDGRSIHTNTIENVFSTFKRGMFGTYQHCGEAHLHRYLAEFDFRYNRRAKLGISDSERANDAIRGAEGKRLTYRRPRQSQDAPPASP